VTLLSKGVSLIRNGCQGLQQRNLALQHRIFDCHPFELEIRHVVALEVNDEE
jgi:hypothetical protein